MACQEEVNSRWSLSKSQVDMRSSIAIVGPPLLIANSVPGIGPQYYNECTSLQKAQRRRKLKGIKRRSWNTMKHNGNWL